MLKHDDNPTPIGELHIDIDNSSYDFIRNTNYDGPVPFFLTYIDSVLSLNERIKLWVSERCPEEDYEFIDALIQKAGLKSYDSYGFFKFNQGRFITDSFYVEPIT